jgi:hypothetical protein
MLVFGDAVETCSPRTRLLELTGRLAELAGLPSDVASHAILCEIFIDAAELAQGLADAEFDAAGKDTSSPMREAAMGLVMALAGALQRSWRSGFADRRLEAQTELQKLAAQTLPETIRCRRAEGYAFYALYPECYLQAAATLGRGLPLKVIGIRSIGLGLAALVAAGAGAGAPVSLRPGGPPFRRSLALDRSLIAKLIQTPATTRYAIADEGPGLSGSSFGAVADLLIEHGVPEKNIHLFPSHAGVPGPAADSHQRQRWARLPRHVVDFDSLFLMERDHASRLDRWFSDIVGTPVAPLHDISGGGWRSLRYKTERDWPPAHMQQERRKFLLRSRSGTWLLKFAGLGRYGRGKFTHTRALHEAGFAAEPVGFRHGFMVERWHDNARSPAIDGAGSDSFLCRLADYIGFRARHFTAAPDAGASIADLASVLRHNGAMALGPGAARPLERLCELDRPSNSAMRRVATDNRMHAWEWLETGDGAFIKADAIDHCAAHDLIGCQDIAWDIAGAAVEFGYSADQRADLCRLVERASGEPINSRLLGFLTPCYLAFQLGYYAIAADALASVPREAQRLRARADYYCDHLRNLLAMRL